MPKRGAETRGSYEVRPHPTLKGLVVIWWLPAAGAPSPTNMTLGAEAVPLLAAALADYELAHIEAPPHPDQPVTRLRVVGEDGVI